MAVKSPEFMASAKLMLSSSSEIDFRNAVSRAYYSVYHSALQNSIRIGLPQYATGSTHERLVESFKNNGHKPIAYRVADHHRKRCIADYKTEVDLSHAQAHSQILSMEQLISDLDAL